MVGTSPYTFFPLHIVFNDYWRALSTLGYSFINQSGSTFKVMGIKRREMKPNLILIPCLIWGKSLAYLQDCLITPFIAGCVSGFHCKPCINILITQLYKLDLDFKIGMYVLDLEASIEAGGLICWLCE